MEQEVDKAWNKHMRCVEVQEEILRGMARRIVRCVEVQEELLSGMARQYIAGDMFITIQGEHDATT